MLESLHSVGATFRDIPVFLVLMPLLMVVGTGLFGYFGVQGVTKRRTLMIGRNGRGGGWVEGKMAVFVGVTYLIIAPMLALIMFPVTLAMFGLI